jgi:hypothetical protein
MSDRTPSSVRTGARTGDSAAPPDSATGESAPVSDTQSIPTTGAQRAVQSGPATAAPEAAATGGTAAPAVASTTGASTVGAPAVPPATEATAVVPPSEGSFVGDTSAAQAAAEPAGPKSKGIRGTTGRPAKVSGRGPRRARLQLRHIDTWSALKISLVLSIALFFIWMVAVGVLYGVLSALGVFDTLNELFGQLGSASGSEVAGDVVTPGVVFGGAAVIGAINIVLLTALCTVGTFIYNLCSDLVGGLELTLSERD